MGTKPGTAHLNSGWAAAVGRKRFRSVVLLVEQNQRRFSSPRSEQARAQQSAEAQVCGMLGICVNRLKLTGWDLELGTINVEIFLTGVSCTLRACFALRHAFTCFTGTPLHPLSIFTLSILIVVSDFEDFHSCLSRCH